MLLLPDDRPASSPLSGRRRRCICGSARARARRAHRFLARSECQAVRLGSADHLRVLGALAPALILVAVVRAIMTAEIHGRIAWRWAACSSSTRRSPSSSG